MGFDSQQKLQFSHIKGLSLTFICSDQHVKYRMPHGFPLTSSLLLDYHIKQYIHTHAQYVGTYVSTYAFVCLFVYFHQLSVTMNNNKVEGSNRDKTMKKQN